MARPRKPAAMAASPPPEIPPELFAITKGLTAPDAMRILKDAQASSLVLWVQHGGLVFDRKKVSFAKHRHMLDVYADECKWQAVIKGGQTGLTVKALLSIAHRMIFDECDLGFYFPNAEALEKLVKTRLNPLIEQVPELKNSVDPRMDTLGVKRFRNRNGGWNNLHLLYVGGTVSKDAVPLNGISVDEVRLISAKDLEQIRYRFVAQEDPTEYYASTAGSAGESIDALYKKGDQRVFLSRCLCQDGGVDLSDCWPECIALPRGKAPYYHCPRCSTKILDPQNGAWVSRKPQITHRHSWSVPGLLGPESAYHPETVWETWEDATDKPEFYRSMLGRPYDDKESTPIDVELLRSCVNAPEWPAFDGKKGLVWGKYLPRGHAKKRRCAMGVDQHQENCHVTIMQRGPDGIAEIIHLETIDRANSIYNINGASASPWIRVRELMHEYDVACCIVDGAPNFDNAKQLALDFSGRVWAATYIESQNDAVRWLDKRNPGEAVTKGGGRILNLKHQVHLHRFRVIEETLALFQHHRIQMPNPFELTQIAFNEERHGWETEAICHDRYWLHLRSIQKEKVDIDKAAGTFKMRWVYKGGIDPHFVHTTAYARIALERASKQPIFSFMPLGTDEDAQAPTPSQPFAAPIPLINMSAERPVGFIVVRGAERDILAATLKALPGGGDVDVFGPCDEMGQIKDTGHCELVRVTGNPSYVRNHIYEQSLAQIVNAFGAFGGLS